MVERERPLRRWRPTVPLMITTWLLCAGCLGLGVVAACTARTVTDRVVISGFLAAMAGMWGSVGLSRIDLYADRVVLIGTHRRPRVIPIERIREVGAGRSGLTFRSGRHAWVSGPAAIGGKSLPKQLLNIRNRGDVIGDAVLAQAEAFRLLHPDLRTELERRLDDLADTVAWSGHGAEAAWLEAVRTTLTTGDPAARARARRDLQRAAVGEIGAFGEIYFGVNRPFVDEQLSRIAELLATER